MAGKSDSDELIQAAYGVASRPQRLIELLETLQDDSIASDESVVPLSPHFARITQMIDEIDPNIGDDFDGFQPGAPDKGAPGNALGELSPSGHLSLMQDSRIAAFDGALFAQAGIEAGQHLPGWMTEIDIKGYRKLKQALRDASLEEAMLIRLRVNPDDEAGQLFAVEPAAQVGGVHLRAIRLRWHERRGALFASVLRLTDTESQLARYIVDGLSIRQFAEARDRSIGTARNQLKAMLKKLGLSSQIELVSLYAGFDASMVAIARGDGLKESDGGGHILDLPGGNILPYELHGDPKGRPVIFLHATADGAYLTKSQDAAARANGLRVIAPWLPFYAGSKLETTGLDAVDEYIDRLEALQDALGVKACPIVTVRVAAPYGFRSVQRDPARFTALVTAGAIVPARQASDFSHLAIGYRAPMRLARAAPSFVKLYFAATAAMVRKGQGNTFFRSLYGNSPADLATLEDPEVVENVRRSLRRTFEDGYQSTLQQTLLSASDWSHFCTGIDAPVKLICGAEDGLAPPARVAALAEEFGFDQVGPLDNVGSLAMHQVARLVFDTVARWA